MARIITVKYFDSWNVDWLQYEVNAIVNSSQPVIPVIIDSYGGELYNALGMIDVLKSAGKPISTMIRSKSMSAGALLATVGTKGMRFMGKNATMMIHDAARWTGGKTGELISSAMEMDRATKLMYSHFDVACRKKAGYFYNEVMARGRADWYLSAEDALALGLIDEIKTPIITSNLDIDDLLLYQQLDSCDLEEM